MTPVVLAQLVITAVVVVVVVAAEVACSVSFEDSFAWVDLVLLVVSSFEGAYLAFRAL